MLPFIFIILVPPYKRDILGGEGGGRERVKRERQTDKK